MKRNVLIQYTIHNVSLIITCDTHTYIRTFEMPSECTI